MSTYICEQPTLTATPCSNPVAWGSRKCAAGHQIPVSRWVDTPGLDDSPTAAAENGSLDFDEIIAQQNAVPGWQRQAMGIQQLLDAGFDPEDVISTVTLDVEVPDETGNTSLHEMDCYATGEDYDINLAHGDLGDGKETWYVVTPCDEPGCNQNAYVSLLGTVSTGDGSSGALAAAIAKSENRSRRAFCPEHRYVHSRA